MNAEQQAHLAMVRNKIADLINVDWNRHRTADAILALTDSDSKPLLAVLDKDQTLPEFDPHERNCEEGCSDPYVLQENMLGKGWRRVILPEGK